MAICSSFFQGTLPRWQVLTAWAVVIVLVWFLCRVPVSTFLVKAMLGHRFPLPLPAKPDPRLLTACTHRIPLGLKPVSLFPRQSLAVTVIDLYFSSDRDTLPGWPVPTMTVLVTALVSETASSPCPANTFREWVKHCGLTAMVAILR